MCPEPNCTLVHCTTQHCTILYNNALHYKRLHNTAIHYKALQNIALHYHGLNSTALHCTALHNTALHYMVMHCTVLPEYRVLLFMDWWPVRPQWPSHGLTLYNAVLHCIVQHTLKCSAVCNIQCSVQCTIQYSVKCTTVQCSVWLVGSALSAGNWKLSQGEDWREGSLGRLKRGTTLWSYEKKYVRTYEKEPLGKWREEKNFGGLKSKKPWGIKKN